MYQIPVDNIDADAAYIVNGVINANVPAGVSEEDAIKSIENALVEQFNLHDKDVNVSYDDLTGQFLYEISTVRTIFSLNMWFCF